MAPEWAAYGTESEDICTAFAAGINAGIDLVRAGDWPLPAEFAKMGTQPQHWAAEDVVRIRTHCLSRNATSELARAQVHRLADPEVDLLRETLSPDVPDTEWQTASDVTLPPTALDAYALATAPVSFAPERLRATLAEAGHWSAVEAGHVVQPAMEGSNNWAIAPAMTRTGRAIMASDPHRAHAAPSLRYMVHLSAPGMDLIGAGEPSSPGIMAGHNGTAAFSLTIFCADQEDVMVYEQTPEGYRYGDGVEAVTEVAEVFAVKGEADQTLTLCFTRHGPVVFEEDGTLVAIRTVFTDPGSAPYMASLKSMRTTTMSAFREALVTWGAPSVNMIYADTAGDICWQAAAFVPERSGWRGLMPVSGAGGFEWTGYRTAADLPFAENPAQGFVHSSNEMNLPLGWDHAAHPVGFEWYEDGRADRVADVIGNSDALDVPASCALQTDAFSQLALDLIACLPADAQGAALELLRSWDGHTTAQSAAALLYERWLSEFLRPAVLAHVAPDQELRKYLTPGDIPTVVRLFQGKHPGLAARLGSPKALLAKTLKAAWEDTCATYGDDTTTWRWDGLHKGYFCHALGADDVGPLPKGGSSTSVMLAHYEAADYRVRVGASVRMVVDVGAWDNSVWINAPGQSGVPGTAHYDDLAPLWAKGDYVPMLYTREAVDKATVKLISLIPESIETAP